VTPGDLSLDVYKVPLLARSPRVTLLLPFTTTLTMQFRSLTVLLAATSAALAAPVEHVPLDKRDVPIEKCTTTKSGYLTGAGNQKFAISKDGKHIVNAGPGSGGLKVQFQACSPNFTKYPNSGSGPYVGRSPLLSGDMPCLTCLGRSHLCPQGQEVFAGSELQPQHNLQPDARGLLLLSRLGPVCVQLLAKGL
jgi:hypothetical protein